MLYPIVIHYPLKDLDMAYLPVQAFAAVWKFVTNRRGKGEKYKIP